MTSLIHVMSSTTQIHPMIQASLMPSWELTKTDPSSPLWVEPGLTYCADPHVICIHYMIFPISWSRHLLLYDPVIIVDRNTWMAMAFSLPFSLVLLALWFNFVPDIINIYNYDIIIALYCAMFLACFLLYSLGKRGHYCVPASCHFHVLAYTSYALHSASMR